MPYLLVLCAALYFTDLVCVNVWAPTACTCCSSSFGGWPEFRGLHLCDSNHVPRAYSQLWQTALTPTPFVSDICGKMLAWSLIPVWLQSCRKDLTGTNSLSPFCKGHALPTCLVFSIATPSSGYNALLLVCSMMISWLASLELVLQMWVLASQGQSAHNLTQPPSKAGDQASTPVCLSI